MRGENGWSLKTIFMLCGANLVVFVVLVILGLLCVCLEAPEYRSGLKFSLQILILLVFLALSGINGFFMGFKRVSVLIPWLVGFMFPLLCFLSLYIVNKNAGQFLSWQCFAILYFVCQLCYAAARFVMFIRRK